MAGDNALDAARSTKSRQHFTGIGQDYSPGNEISFAYLEYCDTIVALLGGGPTSPLFGGRLFG